MTEKHEEVIGKIYDGILASDYQIDVKHPFHDTAETFEAYECPQCHGHFLVESDAMECITTMYCPYCKAEFKEDDSNGQSVKSGGLQ